MNQRNQMNQILATRCGMVPAPFFLSEEDYGGSGFNLWTGYSRLLAKVSQALGSPVSNPLRSHVTRCSEEPCVQLSG